MMRRTQLILAVILFLLCGVTSALAVTDCSDTSATGISQPECEALVALYNSTDGPGWTNNDDWTLTDTPCDWYGVTCGSGHVSKLDLAMNQLSGTLPSELENLAWVTQLLLRGNQLSGSLPPELGNMFSLTLLWLTNNQLSGDIPSELSYLTNLTQLLLGNNQLSGTVPTELENLTNLTQLDISSNASLSGKLPGELTALPLNWLAFNGTGLCEPSDTDFQNWLAGISTADSTGVSCAPVTTTSTTSTTTSSTTTTVPETTTSTSTTTTVPATTTSTSTTTVPVTSTSTSTTTIPITTTVPATTTSTSTTTIPITTTVPATSTSTSTTTVPVTSTSTSTTTIPITTTVPATTTTLPTTTTTIPPVTTTAPATTTTVPATTTSTSSSTTSTTTVPPNLSPADISLGSTGVDENLPPGTEVGTLSTDDPDNPGDSHTYALAPGGSDNDKFTLSGNVLSTAVSFDYETKKTYSVRVRSTDSGGLSFEKSFIISINNVNEKPSDMRLSRVSIPENTPAGTSVGTLAVTDPDSGDTHTWHQVVGPGGWQDNAMFRISGNHLVTAEIPDYESKASHTIHLRCNDSGGASCLKTFVITVSDVNEDPTDIVLSNRWTPEGQPAETEIGFLTATDPDADDTHTYALVPGEGGDDNGFFSIEEDILRTATVFDYETMPHEYHIRVRAADSQGGNREESFVIEIGDVNDPPSEIILGNETVPERMPGGTLVGILTTEDPDDPEGTDAYTYELTDECPGNAYFSVTDDMLETRVPLDYGVSDQRTVCVRVTDAEGGQLVREFWISVIPHEAPVLSSYEATLTPVEEDTEEENSGNSIPEILGSGPVLLADDSFPIGIAVTAADNTNGRWQYSEDRGNEWKDFTRVTGRVGDISEVARLLPTDHAYRIRFVPDLPVTEDITASLTFRAWDMSQGIPGETWDTTVSGGRSAFSGDTVGASVTVLFSEEFVEVRLTGTIRNFMSEPVSGAGVMIFLDDDPANRAIGRDGHYELFTGWYLRHRAHTFEVWPDPPYNDLTEEISFAEDADIVRNIVLGQPGMLCGQVSVGDTGIPVSGALVSAYSAGENWASQMLTDENGIWYFENVPDASDFSVSVSADGYGTQIRTGMSAGSSVSFRIRPALSLSGCVRDEAGAGLSAAIVEIRSVSSGFRASVLTDEDGCYEIASLPAGEICTLTVKKAGYLPASHTVRQSGKPGDIILTRGGSIFGTVTDSTGQPPPDGVRVAVMAFEKGSKGCVAKGLADDAGHFTVSGLVPGMQYLLRFVAMGSSLPVPTQWAGPGGLGTGFGKAEALTPGRSVSFRFDRPWEG